MGLIEQKIQTIIEPVLSEYGARLVDLTFKSNTLQIMIEGTDGSRMGVDDFANISKEISPVLEVEDPIPGAYRLEISSPGIDRPLKTLDDFAKYLGFDAKIELNQPDETGRKRFRGVLSEIQGEAIIIKQDEEFYTIDTGHIERAKLVMSDELIKATKDKH